MANIGIRLTEAQRTELEERSAPFGGNITEYVKSVLFLQQDALGQILMRLDTPAQGTGATPAAGVTLDARDVEGMLVEIVLLMRVAAKPETRKQAWAELERLGLPVWSPNRHQR